MAGYLAPLQRAMGRSMKQIHRVGGFKVQYSLVTDRTANPLTRSVLDIFVQPTSDVKERQDVGGRTIEALTGAGQIAVELLPLYVVSRESLKVAGVIIDPTTDDFFRKLDSSGNPFGNKFVVEQVAATSGKEAGWTLSVRVVFHDAARG